MRKNKKIKLAIASGKGGVGKSMLSSSLALLFSQKNKIIALDCDVDAPNLHLWLGGIKKWDKIEKITTNEIPKINNNKCNLCKKCIKICQFKALSEENKKIKLNTFFCEGCAACEVICPQKAISMEKIYNADIRTKKNLKNFPLISAQLYPGQTGSGKIVDEIKNKAEDFDWQLMVLDAPAGIGCPVIAALNGIDFCLLVTEPTPSGLADLKRVLYIVDHFKINYAVVINKWDINPKLSKKIIKEFNSKILGKISYDQKIFSSIVNLKPIVKTNLKAKDEIITIYNQLVKQL
jgi:MinD superfamily P-loop ATPase